MKIGIEREITKLKNLKSKFSLRYADKSDARKLLREISDFNHLFTSEYIHAQPFYENNTFSKTDVNDGINDLEYYIKSKLKNDKYCIRGSDRINSGIGHIITSLEKKIKSKED
ncbi:hypothetical protein G1J88_11345 [Tenacibaculum dicentrarchi]|uniref:hypothetical protein n=1 Tax=Tenacibaculum piscium TaxID=1458515 RepID=UPI001EFD657C|nr:hypothetical protein [Tenacibaculum piscium]MCG8828975.1 hypothetical protein [Tenacibaculum dicentrarchi]